MSQPGVGVKKSLKDSTSLNNELLNWMVSRTFSSERQAALAPLAVEMGDGDADDAQPVRCGDLFGFLFLSLSIPSEKRVLGLKEHSSS